MAHRRPSVFVASSSCDALLLDAVVRGLKPHADVKPWTEEGFSSLGSNILDWVTGLASTCEFGLFLLTPDARWGEQPNGNVLLELGVFIGALGAGRSFILKPRTYPVPADLTGRILAEYDHDAFVRDGPSALGEALASVVAALQRHAQSLAARARGLWLETKAVGRLENPHSLLQFDAVADRPTIRGRSYAPTGQTLAEWPDVLSTCWVRDELTLYHMFDATVGLFEESSAIGVTVFKFEPTFNAGAGYYVVHGGADIQEGAVRFTLERVTPSLLRRQGLDPAPLAWHDSKRCAELIRALSAG